MITTYTMCTNQHQSHYQHITDSYHQQFAVEEIDPPQGKVSADELQTIKGILLREFH